MDTEPLTTAAGIVALFAYALVLYWALVAYLGALDAADRVAAERWLVVVGGLLVLSLVAVIYGSPALRVGFAAIAGYLVVRGPFARRG